MNEQSESKFVNLSEQTHKKLEIHQVVTRSR